MIWMDMVEVLGSSRCCSGLRWRLGCSVGAVINVPEQAACTRSEHGLVSVLLAAR